MKRKWTLLVVVFSVIFTSLACNLPSALKNVLPEPTATPEPTPTPDYGMIWYQGKGMQILLPSSYVQREVEPDLGAILDSLDQFIGGKDSPLTKLKENVEENIAWWGEDTAAPAVSPTRLLIIKNEALEGLPTNFIVSAVELFLKKDAYDLQITKLTLGKEDVTRFIYSKENTSWSAYLFKEQGMLWAIIFITTPANLAAQQDYFDYSVASIVVEPPQPTPQP